SFVTHRYPTEFRRPRTSLVAAPRTPGTADPMALSNAGGSGRALCDRSARPSPTTLWSTADARALLEIQVHSAIISRRIRRNTLAEIQAKITRNTMTAVRVSTG